MVPPDKLQEALASAYRIERELGAGGMGVPRTVVYTNEPDRQLYRYGLSVSNGRFYFPLIDRKADVWVAEAERK